MRLVRGWQVSEEIDQPAENKIAIAWFASVFNSSLQTIQNQFSDYRLSEALMTTYKLIWDDYCSWFLEMIKPAYQQPIDRRSYEAATGFLDQLIRLLHPFMPFITEEIFHILKEREEGESILLTPQPEAKPFNQGIIDQFIFASEVIIAIRNVRKERNISFKEPIALFIKKNHGEEADTTFDGIIGKLCNLKSISYIDVKSPGCISFIVRSTEFFIPVGDQINAEEDILKIEEELLYTRGFLSKVMLKLNNESFIKNAPVAVVEAERKKQQDAISRIAVLEERITSQKG